MKVFPLIDPGFDEQILMQSPDDLILPNGDDVEDVPISGWMTEDGCIFFLEQEPHFHPITGEKLVKVDLQ